MDSASFRESTLARCPHPREEPAELTGLSPTVSPGPPMPMPPNAVSLALMASSSLRQRPEAEQLAVGDSSGTPSPAASCDGQFSTGLCPFNCQHPVMLCSEGWAWGRQKTDRASQEMALCSHPGSSDICCYSGGSQLLSYQTTVHLADPLHRATPPFHMSSSTSPPKRCWPFLLHPVSACDQESHSMGRRPCTRLLPEIKANVRRGADFRAPAPPLSLTQ